MLAGKFTGRLLESEALGKVAHVCDAYVEDGLQLLGKCRIELHPGDEGCNETLCLSSSCWLESEHVNAFRIN